MPTIDSKAVVVMSQRRWSCERGWQVDLCVVEVRGSEQWRNVHGYLLDRHICVGMWYL